jgi:hypothetical protein
MHRPAGLRLRLLRAMLTSTALVEAVGNGHLRLGNASRLLAFGRTWFRRLMPIPVAASRPQPTAGCARLLVAHRICASGASALLRVVRFGCFAVLAGCTSIPVSLKYSPLEQAATPQALAVVPASYAPESNFATFTNSYAVGAATGALGLGLAGAWLGWLLAPLALLAGPAGIVAIPAIIAGAAGVGVVGGAIAGAAAVVPENQAAVIENVVDTIVAELRLSELTADAIVANARMFTPYRAEVVEGEGPTSRKDVPGYRSLFGRGFGSVIEVGITRIGFAGSGGADPDVILYLAAEARFIDTATGAPIWLRGLAYESPRHRASAWMRDDFALARGQIEQAYRTLAERVVDSALLQSEFWAGRDLQMSRDECGVVPVQPKPHREYPLIGASRLATPGLNSLTPTLAWEPLPRRQPASDQAGWGAAADRRYDLRIWDAFDDSPGAVVYERQGLERAEHEVEIPLKPGSTYFWSVRLRYAVGGHPRATRWGAINTPEYRPGMATKDALFYAATDAGQLRPVPCQASDLTPCGCLDFIPSQNAYRFRTP